MIVMPRRNLGWRQIANWGAKIGMWIGFLIVYLLDTTFLTLATSQAKHQPLLANRLIGITLIYSAFVLGFITWRYHTQLRQNNPRHFGKTPLTMRRLGQLLLLFILMMTIQQIWGLLINAHVLSSPANQTTVDQQVMQLPFWNLAYSIGFAPVIEELIFRGIFLNYFFRADSRLMNFCGVLLSGLIFGYLHVGALSWTLFMYAALGWVLGLAYLHFRDIRYDITLHFLNNAMSLLAYL